MRPLNFVNERPFIWGQALGSELWPEVGLLHHPLRLMDVVDNLADTMRVLHRVVLLDALSFDRGLLT